MSPAKQLNQSSCHYGKGQICVGPGNRVPGGCTLLPPDEYVEHHCVYSIGDAACISHYCSNLIFLPSLGNTFCKVNGEM